AVTLNPQGVRIEPGDLDRSLGRTVVVSLYVPDRHMHAHGILRAYRLLDGGWGGAQLTLDCAEQPLTCRFCKTVAYVPPGKPGRCDRCQTPYVGELTHWQLICGGNG